MAFISLFPSQTPFLRSRFSSFTVGSPRTTSNPSLRRCTLSRFCMSARSPLSHESAHEARYLPIRKSAAADESMTPSSSVPPSSNGRLYDLIYPSSCRSANTETSSFLSAYFVFPPFYLNFHIGRNCAVARLKRNFTIGGLELFSYDLQRMKPRSLF